MPLLNCLKICYPIIGGMLMRWGMLLLYLVLFIALVTLIILGVKQKKNKLWITGVILSIIAFFSLLMVIILYW